MKKKNAISLIVLVITVIVMAILAATIIITLSNTNIISEANDAVQKTEAQQVEEMKALMLADGMLGKNPESQTIGSTTLEWDSVNKEVIEKRNGQLVKEGIIIPKGFYYVGGTKDAGLVISDDATDENKGVDYTCVGNQFVWVPVDDFSKFVRGTAEETATGSGIYKMTGKIGEDHSEPYEEASNWEKTEYSTMMQSVQKYGGFYIARFEAGNENNDTVSKKGATVTLVNWGDSMTEIGTTGAVYLSQKMYKNSSSVASTLCYGVQWDATLNFVSDANHNIVNSVSWGNYYASTGDAATDSGSIQTCGKNEAWKAKNIYDLAGNATEMTMEAYFGGTAVRVNRGGYITYGSNPPASVRNYNHPVGQSDLGFRVALYIK